MDFCRRSRSTPLSFLTWIAAVLVPPVSLAQAASPVPRVVPVAAQAESVLQLDDQDGSLSGVGPSNVDDRSGARPSVPARERPLEEMTMAELVERIEALESRHDTLHERLDTGDLGQIIRRAASAPVLDERPGSLSAVGPSNTDVLPSGEDPYGVGYDGGFFIAPDDPNKDPFELRTNGRMQFRYIGFAREAESWVDSAGKTIPIDNRSDFEIERGRLSFKGFMLDKSLEYYINFDFDTDDFDRVIIHDFWINRVFSEKLDVFVGKAFVPGSREWLNGSTTTRFVDRSLACTFFRPDRSVGVWAEGEYLPHRYYRMMIGDGFNTSGLQPLPDQIDSNFVYSATTWWDIGERYGRGYSDLEWHDELGLEVGTSFTYGREDGPGPIGQPRSEQNFARLADGTRVTADGAVFPGVRINEFDITLFALDAAWKYRGFSFDMEYYFRQLDRIHGVEVATLKPANLPPTVIYNHGFAMEGGWFLIPERFEVNVRTSQIYGDYGPSREYAGGVNWFRNGTHNYKWSFDATQIYGSGAQNSSPNYIAGVTGVLFRLQLQAAF
jgi:hypothetical protein